MENYARLLRQLERDDEPLQLEKRAEAFRAKVSGTVSP
jgi:hypothetical protein